jgi:AraC-like DNA-binding protein
LQPFVRPLFVLRCGAELEDHLRLVIERPITLFPVENWRDLRDALNRAPPAAICIADPFGTEGRSGGLSEDLRDVLRDYPMLTVVAALDVAPQDARLLQTLYSWGVADILDLSRENSPLAVGRRLDEVRGRWAERLLARALPRMTPSRARAMLTVVADVAANGGQIPQLAAALGIDERTVPRWCSRADLPHARRLLAWVRLLLVAELLDDPHRSVESIARACGYAGGVSLNSTLRAFVQMNPSELRRKGAFQTVAEKFRDELRQHRESTRKLGRPDSTWLN